MTFDAVAQAVAPPAVVTTPTAIPLEKLLRATAPGMKFKAVLAVSGIEKITPVPNVPAPVELINSNQHDAVDPGRIANPYTLPAVVFRLTPAVPEVSEVASLAVSAAVDCVVG